MCEWAPPCDFLSICSSAQQRSRRSEADSAVAPRMHIAGTKQRHKKAQSRGSTHVVQALVREYKTKHKEESWVFRPWANSFILTKSSMRRILAQSPPDARPSRPGAISHKLRKQIQVTQSKSIHAPKVQPPNHEHQSNPARKQAARPSRKTIKRYALARRDQIETRRSRL